MKKPTPGKRPLRKNKFPRNLETYPCRNDSLLNLAGESWKPIDGLENCYEISNFGRVKALAREIIYPNGKVIHKKLKINMAGISAAPNYYTGDYTYQLGITLHLENKKFSFSISRLVYHHFVQLFELENKKLLILQKDGNGLNCHYQNLYLDNANNKQKRIYERDRSVSCFGWLDMKEVVKKDLKRRMKPVTQYTDKGKRIRTFESCKAAGEFFGIQGSQINAAAHDYWPRAAGFVWRMGKGPARIDLTDYFEKKKASFKEKRAKKILQYTSSGKKLAEFPSITDASKETGIVFSLISRAANGKLPGTHGFIWKIKN